MDGANEGPTTGRTPPELGSRWAYNTPSACGQCVCVVCQSAGVCPSRRGVAPPPLPLARRSGILRGAHQLERLPAWLIDVPTPKCPNRHRQVPVVPFFACSAVHCSGILTSARPTGSRPEGQQPLCARAVSRQPACACRDPWPRDDYMIPGPVGGWMVG